MENKELQDQLLDKVKGLVDNGNSTLKGELTELVEGIKSANKEGLEKYEERLASMEVEMKKANKFSEEANEPKTLGEAIAKAFADNSDRIKEVANGENLKGVKLNIKAAGTISGGNISGSGDVPQAERIAGFNTIASRQPRLMDLVSSRSTDRDKIDWVYQANKDGAAGQTGEGLTKNQIDFDWVVAEEAVKKTTAFIKVTDEMLAKGSIVSQEVQNELIREVMKAVESEAYQGDATGANLNGLRTVASAFAAGSFAGDVDSANEVDVLAIAMNQIRIAQEGRCMPSAILMHPTDVTRLKLEKLSSTDKRYVERLMYAGQFLSVDGVPIIESTLVTEGEYLIGDFSKAELWQREGMSIEIGYDSDDFTKNLRTIRCEWRGAMVVRNNYRSGFVKGVFATDIAALETA